MKGRSGIPLMFNPTTFLYLSQARTWISNATCCGLFSMIWGHCSFCWYWQTCWPSLFKLSFHKLAAPMCMKWSTINSCAKSAWYARRQHSYNICKDFLSHNSSMKNLNFTNSCTINMNWNIYTYDTFFEKSVKTINSNNSTKFEVNWRRGSQFTARHTKNRLQFDE
jgi:hypothetical protein